MYCVGDVIFYGSTGVCRVEAIEAMIVSGVASDKLYYTLQPLSDNHKEKIYSPVDTPVNMRYVITAEKAQRFIDGVKNIVPNHPDTKNPKLINEFYTELMKDYKTDNLLQIIVNLSLKRAEAQEKNKTLNQTQTSFLKRSQEIVYNEFAYTLNKDYREIKQMIESQLCAF